MTLRALMEVTHPCVLCEGDLAVQTLWRDDTTGREVWSLRQAVPHSCEAMADLMRERARSQRP